MKGYYEIVLVVSGARGGLRMGMGECGAAVGEAVVVWD